MEFIYVTFANDRYEKRWFILCDNDGNPITDIEEAKQYLSFNYPSQYWGIANKEQMLMNNAMRDNF